MIIVVKQTLYKGIISNEMMNEIAYGAFPLYMDSCRSKIVVECEKSGLTFSFIL